MDLREEVLQRLTIPQEAREKLNYNAGHLLVSAMAQMYK